MCIRDRLQLLTTDGTNLVRDPNGLLTASQEPWGNMYGVDSTFLADDACGATPTLSPWPFVPKVSRTVIDVGGLTGDAIQQAIDQAAMMPAGSKPVVHLPKGSYAVAATVTVPAGVAMSIVGDGASPNGTALGWSGASPGPVLSLIHI